MFKMLPASLRNPSLARRLVLLAAGWSIGVLVISAVLLWALVPVLRKWSHGADDYQRAAG